MILVQILLNVLLGFLAHLFRDIATGHMKRAWEDISNYAIGVSSVFPLSFLMFCSLRHEVKSNSTRFIVAYVLSFVSFGAGVVLGHWYKPVVKGKYSD